MYAGVSILTIEDLFYSIFTVSQRLHKKNKYYE